MVLYSYCIQSVNVALLACEHFTQVQEVYINARKEVGEILSGEYSRPKMIPGHVRV